VRPCSFGSGCHIVKPPGIDARSLGSGILFLAFGL